MIDILAVGELLIDMTPIQFDGQKGFQPNPGGAPCNMLAMAQSLGAQTAFIGKVGKDQFGLQLKQTLVNQNINVQGLVMSDQVPTTLAFVHLTEEGDRSFSFYRKNCADVMLTHKEVNYNLIDEAKVIHFGSLSFTDDPLKTTLIKILDYAKDKNKLITYDPNYRPALWSDERTALKYMRLGLKYADILKVSDEEAFLLTGEKDLKEACLKLAEHDIKLITITLGADGCLYHYNGTFEHIPGYKSQVVDTTGAGDSFFGAVISSLYDTSLNELSISQIEDAVRLGNASASLVVEGFGGIPSIPTKEAVIQRLNNK